MDMIYCCSDFHLGFEYTDYNAVISFLDMVQEEGGALYMLGDTLDMWRCPLDAIKHNKPYADAYNKLVETAGKIDVKVVWGNHDYNLAEKVPLLVTDEFVENNILFCHGWRFHVEMCLAYPAFSWLVKEFPYIYQRFFTKPSELKGAGLRTSVSDIHMIAEEYAVRKGYDYIIMGHTHSPQSPEEGKRVFDCGDFVNDMSYVTIEPGHRPELNWFR